MTITPEWTTYRDRNSGVAVTQLTQYKGHSHHFYFTNPGWYDSGRKLLFASDREKPHQSLRDRPCQREHRTTDRSRHRRRCHASWNSCGHVKTRCGKKPISGMTSTYWRWTWSPKKYAPCTRFAPAGVFRRPTARRMECMSILGPGKINPARFEVDLLRGYIGFRETWEARPASQVVHVGVDDGELEVVFEEKYWIGHVNTSPTQPNSLTFCHEGPWDCVDNRIWGLDAGPRAGMEDSPDRQRRDRRARDAGARMGCTSAITVVILPPGRRSWAHPVRWQPAGGKCFPGWTGHIFSNDETLIVSDGRHVIRVWKWDGERYQGPRLLCRHNSSMNIQQTRPRPPHLAGWIVRHLFIRPERLW